MDGSAFLQVNDSTKTITKGSLIDKKTTLVMNTNDKLTFINKKGEAITVNKSGKYSHKDLSKMKPQQESNSFAKNLFAYAWNNFTNNVSTTKNKSGVVYRGDNIVLMRHPADNIKIYASEIRFDWNEVKDKAKDYYFILKDLETNSITKVGLLSNSLSLFVDGSILKESHNYEWTIVENKYENLNKTKFYSFKTLNSSEYEALKEELDALTKYLKELGFNKREIRATICEDYKVCY
jgi:hypothetical protein